MLDQDTARALFTIADERRARLALVGDRHRLPRSVAGVCSTSPPLGPARCAASPWTRCTGSATRSTPGLTLTYAPGSTAVRTFDATPRHAVKIDHPRQ